MSFQVKPFDKIVADMVSWVVANSPEVSDMTPGSLIRSFCEATALTVEELYVATYLGFRRYLSEVPSLIFDFDKKAGTKATSSVIFSRSGTTGTATIVSGTEVSTPTGLSFFTTDLVTIADGNSDSPTIEVEAEEVGTAYNVSANSITVLAESIDGVESVTNSIGAVGGTATESDYQYNQRFQAYIEGLAGSNTAGLIAGALSVEGITSASIVEHFPPISNENVSIYVDDGTLVSVSAEQLAEVQEIIDGDGTESNPGYRAAGVNAVVKAPSIITVNVDVSVEVIEGVDTDQIKTDISTVLTDYINNLGVGADVVYNEMVTSIMGVYGVYNCDITTPTGDTSISSVSVGRFGTLNVTVV